MALAGQASGGFTESSSALRLLHVGIRNTVGSLTDDAFTQTNPVVSTGADISTNINTAKQGVLSGSVAFTRPDQGPNLIGGPAQPAGDIEQFVLPLGLFINDANGNAFENTPGIASGKGPYMSSQGTYSSALFETQVIEGAAGAIAQGTDLVYTSGVELVASVNGLLMPANTIQTGVLIAIDAAVRSLELANNRAASTIIGILKAPADAVLAEIVFDQRI